MDIWSWTILVVLVGLTLWGYKEGPRRIDAALATLVVGVLSFIFSWGAYFGMANLAGYDRIAFLIYGAIGIAVSIGGVIFILVRKRTNEGLILYALLSNVAATLSWLGLGVAYFLTNQMYALGSLPPNKSLRLSFIR